MRLLFCLLSIQLFPGVRPLKICTDTAFTMSSKKRTCIHVKPKNAIITAIFPTACVKKT